jgi:nucleoside-diphosphate-sugar epimerase
MSLLRKVLVTGATGFIGRTTVIALMDAGWSVTQGSRSASEPRIEGTVFLDLTAPQTILELAKGTSFDAIVHLGAFVGFTSETDSHMFVSNVLSTGCLAYLANFWNAHLVFASTAIVHGVRSEKIEADSPVYPDTAYAQSKWLGEQLLAASQIKHCILRIAGVFGAYGPVHLGINKAITDAMHGKPPQQVGSGSALRNYIYVKDVAAAIVCALHRQLVGVHLLAGHETIVIRDMLQSICDVFISNASPLIKDGPEAMSQVIVPSFLLPESRGFYDALVDIRAEQCQ